MDPDQLREEKRYLQTFPQVEDEQPQLSADEEEEVDYAAKLGNLKARLKEKSELLMMEDREPEPGE